MYFSGLESPSVSRLDQVSSSLCVQPQHDARPQETPECVPVCAYTNAQGCAGEGEAMASPGHGGSYGMQMRRLPLQPWALTQSPWVPSVSKQQGIQAENSLLAVR